MPSQTRLRIQPGRSPLLTLSFIEHGFASSRGGARSDTLFHRTRLRIQPGRSPLLTLSFIERPCNSAGHHHAHEQLGMQAQSPERLNEKTATSERWGWSVCLSGMAGWASRQPTSALRAQPTPLRAGAVEPCRVAFSRASTSSSRSTGLLSTANTPMRFTAAIRSGPEPETAMSAASENEARNALINPSPST